MNARSATILSLILTGALLLGGCAAQPAAETEAATSADQTAATATQEETTETTVPSPTPTPAVYDFKWDIREMDEFSRIVYKRYGAVNLKEYIVAYGGFDKELQETFTAYVNDHYGREYETVPFSAVGYFRKNLFTNLSPAYQLKDDYKRFSLSYLNTKAVNSSSFKNKLVMSYLIQNGIPFGERIPTANLMQIRENIDTSKYSVKPYTNNKSKKQTGNFKSDYRYSPEDLLTVLTYYNRSITNICLDYRVMDFVMKTNDAKYEEDSKALIELCNGYLEKHYGENAPKIGSLVTKEQYQGMFGEEALDLSYIQGGVFDQAKAVQNQPFTTETGNEGLKEKITGKWVNNTVKGVSYQVEFKDDNTGTFTTVRNSRNYNSNKLTKKTTKVKFTYKVKFGTMIDLVFENGNREAFFFKDNKVIRLYEFMYFDIWEIRTLNFTKAKSKK